MDQLLIALDVDTGIRALTLADQLRGAAGGFKIGSRLFTAEGPSVVKALVDRGDRVFLDLKFHDIPSVVAAAVQAAADLKVWMITVHASGGAEMLRAAHEAARSAPHGPLVVAVTVLTSLESTGLGELGITRPVLEQVDALARLAQETGLDGVVASPWETARVRQSCGPAFTIVTPGIRSGRESSRTDARGRRDDQARTLSAAATMRAGANYLVVGRPIIAAENPRAAAEQICRELTEQQAS